MDKRSVIGVIYTDENSAKEARENILTMAQLKAELEKNGHKVLGYTKEATDGNQLAIAYIELDQTFRNPEIHHVWVFFLIEDGKIKFAEDFYGEARDFLANNYP